MVRLIEILYFGSPLVTLYRKDGNISYISHLGNSVLQQSTNEDLLDLRDITINLEENIFRLDSGHICSTRVPSHELLSGQYWSQIKSIQSDKQKKFSTQNRVYPIAKQNYFYHFLVEELPEILDVKEKYPETEFLSLAGQPKYVLEYLDLARIKVTFITDLKLKLSRTLIPTYNRTSTLWTIERLQLLRPEEKPLSKRILLLRKGLSRSDTWLEEELINLLLPVGFEVIDPDIFHVKEQIEIFSQCSHIVGIHGAALTNILYSNSKCEIFEIFSHPYRASDFFQKLSYLNGNPYQCSEKDEAISKLKLWLPGKNF